MPRTIVGVIPQGFAHRGTEAFVPLARAAARRREVAVRTAVGATRGRLVRQFPTESVMLALLGAALGLGLAFAGVRAFVAEAPPVVPRMTSIAINVPVLLFTLGVALGTGILFGLAPMLHAGAGGPGEALKDECARSGGSWGSRRAGEVLVVTEIALSLVLLVGAGLMVKSLLHLQRQDLGLVVDRVVAFGLSLPTARYDSSARIQQYYQNALGRLRSVPGVRAVGLISHLPFRDGAGRNGYFNVERKTLWRPNDAPVAEIRLVDADYYRTMGIPLVSGRFFNEQDDERAKPVVIVNQALARRCWPNEDAVGKRINLGAPPWLEVVGVVGDVRIYQPALAPPFEIAVPSQQRHEFGVRLAMGAAPGALLRMVLARGASLAGVGIALGGLGAMALTRLMNSILYQVTATDPTVLVPTCIAVFAAALAACYGPAPAAARVDPIQTLGAS